MLVGHPEDRPSYAVSSICRRRCWERFQAAIRMIAQQPTALPKNTDAIVQSFGSRAHRPLPTHARRGTDPRSRASFRDLEAVVDALNLDRFALIGSSRGGSTAIAYAARHPERVSHLVLYGAFAQGWRIWGNSAEIEWIKAIITLVRQSWATDNPAARQILTSLVLPDGTLEEMSWFNDLQRISLSAENAAWLLRSNGEVNVLDLLPGITAPTLVLHCRDDVIPFDQGRLIASRIPRARLVALESRNHLLLPRDPAWAAFVSEVRRFLCEEGTPMTSRASRTDGSAGREL